MKTISTLLLPMVFVCSQTILPARTLYNASGTLLAPTCNDPDIPTFTVIGNNSCPGNTVIVSVTGNLNDASAWYVYTGSCGGSLLKTSPGNFTVNPTFTTTYYVRGEGGCVTPGACANVTVTVSTLIDDPSFSYSSGTYCSSETDPVPVVTGTPGGNFSAAPSGLSLNASNGTIDLSASTPGSYSVVYTTAGPNCPASSNTMITVHPSYTPALSATICASDTFMLGSQVLTTPGVYTGNFQSISGCDSVVTLTLNVHPEYNDTTAMTICDGTIFTFGTQTLSVAGMYAELFQSIQGCDSLVTLNLGVNSVNTTVSQTTGVTLTAASAGGSFQWLNCDNNYAPVSGATSGSFTAGVNGNYAVRVTENGCTDTSQCVAITGVGLLELASHPMVTLFPNPTSGRVQVQFAEKDAATYLHVFNAQGQPVLYKNAPGNTFTLDLSAWPAGIYVLQINRNNSLQQLTLLKE